jgi:hypothetical protein
MTSECFVQRLFRNIIKNLSDNAVLLKTENTIMFHSFIESVFQRILEKDMQLFFSFNNPLQSLFALTLF